MAAYRGCVFYIKGNKCTSVNAPRPGRSKCIGKQTCGDAAKPGSHYFYRGSR